MNPAPPAEAVRTWVGGKYYDRGKALAGPDAVQAGTTYEASGGVRVCGRVEGTYAPFYRVGATVTGGRVTAAACTCPIGTDGDGKCKHVAALLIGWRTRPEEFSPGENPRAALARRTKAELAALVLDLLNRPAAVDEEGWDRDPEEWAAADHGLAPDPAPPAA